jgi:hypothetical protein
MGFLMGMLVSEQSSVEAEWEVETTKDLFSAATLDGIMIHSLFRFSREADFYSEAVIHRGALDTMAAHVIVYGSDSIFPFKRD